MKISTLIKTSTGIAFSLLIGSFLSSSALFFSSSALAGISNIRNMSQNSNGSFNVTCLNGSTETVDAQAIAQNLVCKTGVQPVPLKKAVSCTGDKREQAMDWFYVTRVADGKKFGDFGDKLPLKVCQQIVEASSPQVVCTGHHFFDEFYLTRISDGKQFGERLSLKNCLHLSRESSGRQ